MADRQPTIQKSMITRQKTQDESDTRKNIQVVCRIKPLTLREKDSSDTQCLDFIPAQNSIRVKSHPDSYFSFDQVFSPNSTQTQIFDCVGLPIIKSVLVGFNGTMLAYGQTCSGKTYTMLGPDISDPMLKGLIPRICKTIFEEIQEAETDLEFSVKISFCEIYLEKIRDLLNSRKSNLKIAEDKTRGVFIKDLTEVYVASEGEVLNLLKIGTKQREIAGTLMNEESSRSHAIFMVTISQHNTQDLSAKTGKMFMVDLAGSEKLSKSAAEGKRLDETKNINKSLSALGNVICALTDGKSAHVPYRDSKLTRVLSESLGGNSKTSLIVTVSSALSNENETLSTLRFGVRAKAVKNKPVVNKELSLAELKLMLTQANDCVMRKDCRIKWLEEKIVELTNDEEIINKVYLKNEEQFSEGIERNCDGFSQTRVKELEDELKSCTLRNSALVRENDDLNGKICFLNNVVEEFKEKVMELGDTVSMQRAKLDAQDKDFKAFEDTNLKLESLVEQMKKQMEEMEKRFEGLAIDANLKKELDSDLMNSDPSSKSLVSNETLTYSVQTRISKEMSLEKNLEQLNLMYLVISNKCSSMKNDLMVYEKKCQRKTDRINYLDKNLRKAVEQLNHFKYKLEQMNKDTKDQIKDHPKIKKMIKGGSSARTINILCPYSINSAE